MLKKICVFCLLSIAAVPFSCSSKQDISGMYVPYRGPVTYYSLSINNAGSTGKYNITLEGVPLQNMQTTPWSLTCSSRLSKNKMACDDFSLDFSRNFEIVTVLYESDLESSNRQTFISAAKSFEEEIVIYDKKGK